MERGIVDWGPEKRPAPRGCGVIFVWAAAALVLITFAAPFVGAFTSPALTLIIRAVAAAVAVAAGVAAAVRREMATGGMWVAFAGAVVLCVLLAVSGQFPFLGPHLPGLGAFLVLVGLVIHRYQRFHLGTSY